MLPLDSTPRTLDKLADSRSAEIYTWGTEHVVKLFRSGFPREAIEQEAQNATMVHALRVPTPKPEGIVEFKGRTGIVFERCDGPALYELIVRRARPLKTLARVFFELQLGMHRARHPALPSATRTLADAILRARVPEPVKRRALDVFQSMPRGDAVCHGDYHPLNVLLPADGPRAVDWLDAGTGDPMYDVARSLLYLRYARHGDIDAGTRAAFVKWYAHHCREAWKDDCERLERWRLPVAVARLASVADGDEYRALLELIEGDLGRHSG